MVDNFDLIKKYLVFDTKDMFYFLQIIIRNKDFDINLNRNNRIVKSYYISSIRNYDEAKEEVKTLCKVFHARAYINLNSKSFKVCTLRGISELSKSVLDSNYRNIKSVRDTVAGKYSDGVHRRWIVDIDEKEDLNNIDAIISYINTLRPFNSYRGVISTVHGMHIITDRFDVLTFSKLYPNISIHKNNPTILYYE